jgi:hypothetical protein
MKTYSLLERLRSDGHRVLEVKERKDASDISTRS